MYFLRLLIAAGCLFGFTALAEERLPEELQDIKIQERLGDTIPLDLTFTDENGKEVVLGDLFRGKKPVVLNLLYYQCPMLCNLVLNGLVDGMNQMAWIPGKEFKVISVSIDPTETHEIASTKREAYVKTLDKGVQGEGWRFLTGDSGSITKLSSSVGFRYKMLENGEYTHAAALFMISPTGKISRYLYGLEYKGFDIKRALLDAADEKTISLLDKVMVYCYRYSKDANGYVLFAENFMRGSGYVVLSLVVLLFGSLWLAEWRKRKRRGGLAQAVRFKTHR